jgi:hypothetical protein
VSNSGFGWGNSFSFDIFVMNGVWEGCGVVILGLRAFVENEHISLGEWYRKWVSICENARIVCKMGEDRGLTGD